MNRPLTYRSSGVDISQNLDANDGASSLIPSTFNSRVVTKPGLFAGVLDLGDLTEDRPFLNASIGFYNQSQEVPSSMVDEAISRCLEKIPGNHLPLGMLDYLASFPLDALRIKSVLQSICKNLSNRSPVIPLVGGETAEMPGVFVEDQLELTTTLFSLSDKPMDSSLDLRTVLEGFQEPCVALSMDGVGTKSRLLHDYSRFPSALSDILNHSLGDLLCLGARGVGITLYVGCHTPTDQVQALKTHARHLIFSQGLEIFDFVIHEAPDRYLPGQVDLVGSVAGVVEKSKILTGDRVCEGDIVVGLSSDGLHTNGYSLVNKLMERLNNHDIPQWVIEGLLAPHKNYLPMVYPLLEDASRVHGIAHITGGGLRENLVRIIPEGLGVELDLRSIEIPELFQWIQDEGSVPFTDLKEKGMLETFNMGVGLILVLDPASLDYVTNALKKLGEEIFILGHVEKSGGRLSHERIHCITRSS